MACIRENLEGNLPKEDLDHFLHGGFSKSQIREIAFGLSGELGLENIKLYADPKISSEKMEDLREKIEDIRNRYHSEYSNEKIENYAYAYKNGLSINQSEYLIESCKLEKDEISIIIKGMKLQNHPQNKSVMKSLPVLNPNMVPQKKEICERIDNNYFQGGLIMLSLINR